MEDALLSMESFAILSGAGLMDAGPEKGQAIYVHQTSQILVEKTNEIKIPAEACWNGWELSEEEKTNPTTKKGLQYKDAADIFVMVLKNGEVAAEPCIPVSVEFDKVKDKQGNEVDGTILTCYSHEGILKTDTVVLVDYYVKRTSGSQMIEITADKFGGNYYLEASTLFRRESDGVDMPAEFIIPNCKVQSNFTFSLAASGDPSTFTFTLDAFPDYTKFDPTHKVLAAIQVISDESGETEDTRKPCKEGFDEMGSYKANVDAREPSITTRICGDDDTTVIVTGTSDGVSGTSYDPVLFGDISDSAKATEIILKLPTSKNGGDYVVIQNNPVLAHFQDSSNGVIGNKKTKSYHTIANEQLEYSFLVSDEVGPIDVELQEQIKNNEGVVTSTKSIIKYIVATSVKFN